MQERYPPAARGARAPLWRVLAKPAVDSARSCVPSADARHRCDACIDGTRDYPGSRQSERRTGATAVRWRRRRRTPAEPEHQHGAQLESMMSNGVEQHSADLRFGASPAGAELGKHPVRGPGILPERRRRPDDVRLHGPPGRDRRRAWALDTPGDPLRAPVGHPLPKSNPPMASYMTALVDRYGPHGSFWSENPQLPRIPIRMWELCGKYAHDPEDRGIPSVCGFEIP
jgi:hypothetical protein